MAVFLKHLWSKFTKIWYRSSSKIGEIGSRYRIHVLRDADIWPMKYIVYTHVNDVKYIMEDSCNC